MYKVFSGEKCIIISAGEIKAVEKDSKTISFITDEALYLEYKQFVHASDFKKLIVTGDEKIIWKVFCSLFSFIEAAGGLVKNEKDELLMIFRNGYWDLPKGKMEIGESPEETALREVEEECGVQKLKIVKPLASTYHIFLKKKKECIKRTYWFEMICNDSSQPIPQAEEGIVQAKWMSKDEVKKILNQVYPSLREVLSAI